MKHKPRKCIVRRCQNKSNQGNFVGPFCKPCFDYFKTGLGITSQAFRNDAQQAINEAIRKKLT